jgi:hypothetical protein
MHGPLSSYLYLYLIIKGEAFPWFGPSNFVRRPCFVRVANFLPHEAIAVSVANFLAARRAFAFVLPGVTRTEVSRDHANQPAQILPKLLYLPQEERHAACLYLYTRPVLL